jgi:hypothetical protein
LEVSFVETEITISFWGEIFFLVMEMIFSWVIFSWEREKTFLVGIFF